jgi:enterochelin esterase family protein
VRSRLTFLIAFAIALPCVAAKLDISQMPDADIKKGTAVVSEGPDFLWAVEADKQPILYVDDQRMGLLKRASQHGVWTYSGKLTTGTSHAFYYMVDGKRFGGLTDIHAYGTDSYLQTGVPKGRLSEKMVHTSKIYPGMKSDYWVYTPAQYDPNTPAALMVWNDGYQLVERDGVTRAQNVFDNLTYQKKIPVIVHVLISPGMIGEKAMRSIEYDMVSDQYDRFLNEELLPEVYAKYNIRRDAYSHAIAGNSSGGICSFNAAWWHPELFSRVLSRIGTFTSIQWKPGVIDGGNIFPFAVRKEPKRNIRVWLQDGSEDMENRQGSWPLQNIQMANALKIRDYDFHFVFGNGTHNHAQGESELPEEMQWLWRDYDPAKTEQNYEMEPAEKAKPVFRVKIYNR